jgi:3-methylcrotonyl-CoA carboxylase alpha subunit/geranyl-CoA carboxylase alpha subunit
VATAADGLRFDHAIEAGLEVTPHYDAMLGKLIVHADTRESAIDRLVQALGQTELLGLPSNRAFLAACLDHPTFRAGQALIPFLASHAEGLREVLLRKELITPIAYGLAAILGQAAGLQGLPCPFARPLRLRQRGTVTALSVRETGEACLQLDALDGAAVPARPLYLARLPDGAVQCTLDGVTQRLRVARVGARRWHLQAGAVDWWLEDASFEPPVLAGQGQNATELRAPFNGRVVSVSAQVGQVLAAGDTAVIIESMKLEHSVASPGALTVAEVLVSTGQQVAPGQVLLRFVQESPP